MNKKTKNKNVPQVIRHPLLRYWWEKTNKKIASGKATGG
jgi:hypothetical protein